MVEIGFLTDDDVAESRALGINAKGQVTGWSLWDPPSLPGSALFERPFIWLPEDDDGLGGTGMAAGLHRIDVWGPAPDLAARGYDINDAGIVVGEAEHEELRSPEGFLWLGTPFEEWPVKAMIPMGFLYDPGPPFAPESVATAISDVHFVLDHFEFRVAGHGRTIGGSTCGLVPSPAAADWSSGQESWTALEDPAPALPGARGYGINPMRGSGHPPEQYIVGAGEVCTLTGDCVPGIVDSVPMAWIEGERHDLSLPSAFVEGHFGAAFDVTDDRRIVGYAGGVTTGGSGLPACGDVPLTWSSEAAIGEVLPSGGEEAQARAINATHQIVGTLTIAGDAMLWEPDGSGGWLASNLEDEIAANCGWDLRRADAINNDGWIGATGVPTDVPGDVRLRALVLIPLGDCPADVNQDGVVDQADLALVIQSLGTTTCANATGVVCREDVNADCQVGQLDAQIVIRSYGPCSGGGSGLSAPDVATWMAIGGEASIDAGAIDAAEIGTALDAETPPARLLELYMLLIEEGMP